MANQDLVRDVNLLAMEPARLTAGRVALGYKSPEEFEKSVATEPKSQGATLSFSGMRISIDPM